jgi:hypothetical protein
MRFSRTTLVRLAEGIAAANTHPELDSLFYEFGVQNSDPGSAAANKIKRSVTLIRAIEETLPDARADEIAFELANRVLGNAWVRRNLGSFLASLAIDGFEWGADRLVPSNPGPASLAPELTALEQELNAAGLNVEMSR